MGGEGGGLRLESRSTLEVNWQEKGRFGSKWGVGVGDWLF